MANNWTPTTDPRTTAGSAGLSCATGEAAAQPGSRGARLPGGQPPSMLDRIVFAGPAGGRLRPVASSLSGGEIAAWAEHIGIHRATARDDRPTASMWYSSDGGAAALLYRMRGPHLAGPDLIGDAHGSVAGNAGDGHGDNAGADHGFDRCHALVGWHQDLTPDRALRTHGWEGWTGREWTGTELRPLDVGGSERRWAQPTELDAAAVEQQASLTAVVAAVLRQPRRPVSIVTDRGDLAERAALLWGLYAVVGNLFAVPGEPPFTFSTFEAMADHGAHEPPQVIFLPPDADEPRLAARRRVIRLPAAQDRRDDAYSFAAKAMVRRYLRGGVDAVQDWLHRRRVLDTHLLAERLNRVVECTDTVAAVPHRMPGASVADEPVADEVSLSPQELTEVGDLELVALLGTAGRQTVRRVVHAVRQRRGPRDTRRAEVRDLLAGNGFFERRLYAVLPPPDARRALGDLVRFALARADLTDDRTLAEVRRLVSWPDTSPAVVDSLVALAVEYGEQAALLEAAGLRWMREHGHPVSEAVPASGARQSTQREPRPGNYGRLMRAGRT